MDSAVPIPETGFHATAQTPKKRKRQRGVMTTDCERKMTDAFAKRAGKPDSRFLVELAGLSKPGLSAADCVCDVPEWRHCGDLRKSGRIARPVRDHLRPCKVSHIGQRHRACIADFRPNAQPVTLSVQEYRLRLDSWPPMPKPRTSLSRISQTDLPGLRVSISLGFANGWPRRRKYPITRLLRSPSAAVANCGRQAVKSDNHFVAAPQWRRWTPA